MVFLYFFNSINKIIRNFTNKAELDRVSVPLSLQQRRYVLSLSQFGTKVAPICVNTFKMVGTGLGYIRSENTFYKR